MAKEVDVPPRCLACRYGRNCINGRFCVRLYRYVTHIVKEPCTMTGAGLQQTP